MFEISMGAIFALILLGLFPSLRIGVFYLVGFAFLALLSGGLTYLLACRLGVITQNAFWIGSVIGLLSGAFATHYLGRLRHGRRDFDRLILR